MGRLLKFTKSDDGSVLIESTIAMFSLLLVVLGVMEFSRALYADIFIGYAAHSATRYAMVRGSSWNPNTCSASLSSNCTAASSDVVQFVKGLAPLGIDTANSLTVTPSWPGTSAAGGACVTSNGPASPGCVIQVQVSYNFHFLLSFVFSSPILFQSTSVVTIAQ